MPNCSDCGIPLNALNMIDIEEDKCQDCVSKRIEALEPLDESPETIRVTDEIMNKIVTDKSCSGFGYRWGNAKAAHSL